MTRLSTTLSPVDFLGWENAQDTRNEFCCGEVFAAKGVRRVHGLVAGNLAVALIVEVLSDSTQAYDRGLKFTAYRQVASLQKYVLVDPDTRRVEVYRRNERQNFELIDQSGHAELVLDSVGMRLAMAEVFDGLSADCI